MKGDGPDLPIIPDGIYTDGEEIARGGLGRVLKVTDQSMGRVVALKELLPEADIEEARFVREALVTGRLEHPSIVPVYEAGRWPSGEPFYTMKLVSGRSLREVVKETGGLRERLALLPNVIAVAEALAYAHSKRVIHRDIKPANVIVGQFGETIVIDWGLAKDMGAAEAPIVGGGRPGSADEELTQLGDVLGTPAYMAPEQARGESVDERADVYALGALLYFVLAGVAPHEQTEAVRPGGLAFALGATTHDHRKGGQRREETGTDHITRVAMRQPVPLVERRPDLPPELVAVVEKAMARDAADRYPSARQLADDLKAFQTGRMVSAHHYTSWERVRRFVAKHRIPVAVAAIATGVLAVGAAVSVRNILAARDEAERRGAEALSARGVAQEEREHAERRARELVLLQARSSLARDPTAALAWLKTYPDDAVGWEAARAVVTEALARGVARDVWQLGTGPVSWVAASPDGWRLAVVAGDGSVRIHDEDLGWFTVGSVGSSGGSLAWSPDSKWLAAGGNQRAVMLFSLDATQAPRMLGQHEDTVNAVAFSPDGTTVASTSTDRTVRLWPVAGGEPRVLRGHELMTTGVTFSPGGKWLATGSEDATLRIWDVASGTMQKVLRAERSVVDVAFSPDGRTVAAATRAGPRLFDLESGERRVLGDAIADEAYAVSWHRSGRLVTAGTDGLAVWEQSLGPGAAARLLLGHDGSVNTASLSPDGATVYSGGADGTVRVWPLRPAAGELLREGNQPGGTAARPRISRNGRSLAAPGQDGTILLIHDGARMTLRGHQGPAREVVFSPDGTRLASYGIDRTVRLWDVAGGGGRVLLEVPTQAFRLRWAPDGRRLALTQGFEELDIIDVETGKIGCVFRGKNDSASEFAPDGKHIAYADGYDLRLGDVDACISELLYAHRGSIFGVAWRHDGGAVASAAADRAVGLMALPGGTATMLRGHEREVYAVRFSPDDKLLASTGFDGVVRVWSAGGQPLRALRGHDKVVLFAAFTPDGKLLATSGADDTVRVWDLGTGDMVQRESDTGQGGLAIAPDGAWVLSAGPRGLRRWPLDRRDAVPAETGEVLGLIYRTTRARIDENGDAYSPVKR